MSQVQSLSRPHRENGSESVIYEVAEEGETGTIRTSVRTPPGDVEVLQAAIDRLTLALATADDATIGDLVTERAALRRELAEVREGGAGVVRLDDERARRGRRR